MRRQLVNRIKILIIIFALLVPQLASPRLALAAPTRVQLYYLSMPEDDALQMFYDDGDHSAVSPLASVTSIAIATTGTVIYYDQWENSYAADIITGADQIWGDGNLLNGCPPNKNNTPNPCLIAADDQLNAGNVVVLSNNVIVNGAAGGPYSRNPAQVYYDGRDKLLSIYPVAVTRALFPVNVGSLQAGGVEVIDTTLWGSQYISPYGEGGGSTGLFEDVRLFVMGGPGGSTINLDLNDDGDTADAGELTNYLIAEGGKYVVNGPQARSKLTVVSGSNVQVNVVYADTTDTFELRWSALLPRSSWTNDYYTPVGTATGGQGCTNVWVYNPATSTITVNYTFGNGTSGNFTVNARSNAVSPQIPSGYGARLYTANAADVFLPFSVTDCTGGGQIMDWDTPLFPSNKLTPDLLVGWAPGCTDESHLGVCRDPDGSPNLAASVSRNVVWVTPLNNTTVYVDTNGSGITCPGGVGAEQTTAATALFSYRINNDPTSQNNVRDEFETRNYNTNGPNNSANWTTAWDETNDDDSATTASGSMLITNNGGGNNDFLQFQNSSASNEANDTIQRTRNLSGQIFARFSFQIQSTTADAGEDRLVAEVSPNGGTSWYTLEQFDGPTTLSTMVYNISPYISVNTTIRFRFVDNLEAGDIWQVDNVNIQYAPNGDFDMTGAFISTCDGTRLAAAYGQDPTKSESSDYEALDLGTVIVPYYGSLIDISLDKQVSDDTPDIGSTVTFSLVVANASGRSTATNVDVTDVLSNGYAYVPGSIAGGNVRNDNNPNTTGLTWTINSLDPGTSTTLTYQAVILGGASMYDNYAEINDADQPDIDSTPGNGSSNEDDNDTQVVTPNSAAIGNLVWLDEDGNGYQDAGETGIANITVELWNAGHTSLLASTITDASGNYIFKNIAAGTYQVDVLNSSLPAGLVQTRIPGGSGDFINKSDPYTLIIAAGSENLQADFGFNWAPSSDTEGNMGSGAIGDRLWIDDGDGLQESGEPGLYNVTVELLTAGADGIFGTADDAVAATTTSGYDGSYIFDTLPAGAYVVRVNGGNPPVNYTPVGDPDQPGAACTTCDNRTTTPILLAPGDVYVNADFGYLPDGGFGGNIGDTVWLDANGNNTLDAGEPGLAGVTVALIRDLDSDGVWDTGEPIIASDVTDTNGQYLFTGLPVTDGIGSDDYIVWVNDTENVLFELFPSYDSNGTATPNLSAVTNLTAAGDLNQDFAYAPPGHASGEGLIGDTIYLDRDGGNDYDLGEGLEGARVDLYSDTNGDGNYDAGEPLIFTTLTNENGQYFFGNLLAGNYVVKVDTSTLPAGVSNTVDPDSGAPGNVANESGTNLTAGEVDLAQDFGYAAVIPHTISGTLWRDTNASGTLETITETLRLADVTVVLYGANGNLVATTTTDGSGNYAFSGLPDSTYRVDVRDDANVLEGYWHSQGDQAQSSDGTSKADPYTVTLSGSDVNTVDFGYYRDPAQVGNLVWLDRNNDGFQDADEPGVQGIAVTLMITYTNGVTTTVGILSGPGGVYNFGFLLLDENYDGLGVNEPVYTIYVGTPPGMISSPEALPGNNDEVDGDSDGASETIVIIKSESDPSYDFGFFGFLDLGDLPSNYPTLFSPGPAHVVFPDNDLNGTPDTTDEIPAVWLGLTVDTEPNGQPSTDAKGDGPDEDGMVLAPHGWIPGSSSTLTLTLNSSGLGVTVFYGIWIDWGTNNPPDGTFDAFYSGSGVTSSPVEVPVVVSVPGSYVSPNNVYFRVRVYDAPLTSADYQGSFVNGEVEDYLLVFSPTAVELVTLKAAVRSESALLPLIFWISLMSGSLSLVIISHRRRSRIRSFAGDL
jgi:uncharacterized repeat protein (TIGR01451 family)